MSQIQNIQGSAQKNSCPATRTNTLLLFEQGRESNLMLLTPSTFEAFVGHLNIVRIIRRRRSTTMDGCATPPTPPPPHHARFLRREEKSLQITVTCRFFSFVFSHHLQENKINTEKIIVIFYSRPFQTSLYFLFFFSCSTLTCKLNGIAEEWKLACPWNRKQYTRQHNNIRGLSTTSSSSS